MMSKELLKEALDVIMEADTSSGYCTCGKRVVMHRKSDGHDPVDTGDKRAMELLVKIKRAIGE